MKIYSVITFYVLIVLGYSWTLVQIIVHEPFDALVLFAVTFFLHMYRNAIKAANKVE